MHDSPKSVGTGYYEQDINETIRDDVLHRMEEKNSMEIPHLPITFPNPNEQAWHSHQLTSEEFSRFRTPRGTERNQLKVKYTTLGSDYCKTHGTVLGLWYHVKNGVLDYYAAFAIFWRHLITFETIVVVGVAVAATLFYFEIRQGDNNHATFGAELSWILVSFAVVSPMIMQIKQAFTRRETALLILAECTYSDNV